MKKKYLLYSLVSLLLLSGCYDREEKLPHPLWENYLICNIKLMTIHCA